MSPTNLKMGYYKLCVKFISVIFIYNIPIATSNHHSNLLSRIYKKAADQEKPIILVLDTANYETVAEAARFKDFSGFESNRNASIEPFLYLYQLGQKSPVTKKVALKERIWDTEDRYKRSNVRSKARTTKRAPNQGYGNQLNRKQQKRLNHYYAKHNNGIDKAKSYIIKRDIEMMIKNSHNLRNLLRMPSKAKGDDRPCSASSENRPDNAAKKQCDEYVRKAAECTGLNFMSYLNNQTGDIDTKLPSTMGGVLLHEIDWS